MAKKKSAKKTTVNNQLGTPEPNLNGKAKKDNNGLQAWERGEGVKCGKATFE